MTKKEYLETSLKNGGMTGRIYQSVGEMKHAQGTFYGAVLRGKDTPTRSKSKKFYRDQEDCSMLRRKHYDCVTEYNVIIAAATEEKAEEVLEGFLVCLGKGFIDDNGNWVGIEPDEADWVDEDDSVLKAKVAVQVIIKCRYGIYTDAEAGALPSETSVTFTDE